MLGEEVGHGSPAARIINVKVGADDGAMRICGGAAASVTALTVGYARAVKMLRRASLALSVAGIVAGVLRLRGKGGVPPQQGGWRELSTQPK